MDFFQALLPHKIDFCPEELGYSLLVVVITALRYTFALCTLSKVDILCTGSFGFDVPGQEHIMAFIRSVLLLDHRPQLGHQSGSMQAWLKQVAGEVKQGGICGIELRLPSKPANNAFRPFFDS